jgi:hypothetical protein
MSSPLVWNADGDTPTSTPGLRHLIIELRQHEADPSTLIATKLARIRNVLSQEGQSSYKRRSALLKLAHLIAFYAPPNTSFASPATLRLLASRDLAEKTTGYLLLALLCEQSECDAEAVASLRLITSNTLLVDLEAQTPWATSKALSLLANVPGDNSASSIAQALSNIYVDCRNTNDHRRRSALAILSALRRSPEEVGIHPATTLPPFVTAIPSIITAVAGASEPAFGVAMASVRLAAALQPLVPPEVTADACTAAARLLNRLLAMQSQVPGMEQADPGLDSDSSGFAGPSLRLSGQLPPPPPDLVHHALLAPWLQIATLELLAVAPADCFAPDAPVALDTLLRCTLHFPRHPSGCQASSQFDASYSNLRAAIMIAAIGCVLKTPLRHNHDLFVDVLARINALLAPSSGPRSRSLGLRWAKEALLLSSADTDCRPPTAQSTPYETAIRLFQPSFDSCLALITDEDPALRVQAIGLAAAICPSNSKCFLSLVDAVCTAISTPCDETSSRELAARATLVLEAAAPLPADYADAAFRLALAAAATTTEIPRAVATRLLATLNVCDAAVRASLIPRCIAILRRESPTPHLVEALGAVLVLGELAPVVASGRSHELVLETLAQTVRFPPNHVSEVAALATTAIAKLAAVCPQLIPVATETLRVAAVHSDPDVAQRAIEALAAFRYGAVAVNALYGAGSPSTAGTLVSSASPLRCMASLAPAINATPVDGSLVASPHSLALDDFVTPTLDQDLTARPVAPPTAPPTARSIVADVQAALRLARQLPPFSDDLTAADGAEISASVAVRGCEVRVLLAIRAARPLTALSVQLPPGLGLLVAPATDVHITQSTKAVIAVNGAAYDGTPLHLSFWARGSACPVSLELHLPVSFLTTGRPLSGKPSRRQWDAAWASHIASSRSAATVALASFLATAIDRTAMLSVVPAATGNSPSPSIDAISLVSTADGPVPCLVRFSPASTGALVEVRSPCKETCGPVARDLCRLLALTTVVLQ